MLRPLLLYASRNDRVQRLVRNAPVSRSVVRRFVAGESVDDAVRVARELVGRGLHVSLDRLGEDTLDEGQAEATTAAYVELLDRLARERLADRTEVSLKLSALGAALGSGGTALSQQNAATICAAAARAGTTVTVDMEDHTTTDATLAAVRELRADYPWLGAVVQSYLRRTDSDCTQLAGPGSRVRLCKGAYAEPAEVAYQSRGEVDRSYVRCLTTLMAGDGYPMVATHDPRLIAAADMLAHRYGRTPGSYEFQMLHGIRPDEQVRLAAQGETVRVYVPYGDEWYAYLMRRLAERPANLTFFLRALASRS